VGDVLTEEELKLDGESLDDFGIEKPEWIPIPVEEPGDGWIPDPEDLIPSPDALPTLPLPETDPLSIQQPTLSVDDPSPLTVEDPSPLAVEEVDPIPVEDPDSGPSGPEDLIPAPDDLPTLPLPDRLRDPAPLPVEEVDPIEVDVDVSVETTATTTSTRRGPRGRSGGSSDQPPRFLERPFERTGHEMDDFAAWGTDKASDLAEQGTDRFALTGGSGQDQDRPSQRGMYAPFESLDAPGSRGSSTSSTASTSTEVSVQTGDVNVEVTDLDRFVDEVMSETESMVADTHDELQAEIDQLRREISRGR
jgi:hypothetical protein